MPRLRPSQTVPGVCPSCSMAARPPVSAAITLRPGTEWLSSFEFSCNVPGHEQARRPIRDWIQSASETRGSGVGCPRKHGPAVTASPSSAYGLSPSSRSVVLTWMGLSTQTITDAAGGAVRALRRYDRRRHPITDRLLSFCQGPVSSPATCRSPPPTPPPSLVRISLPYPQPSGRVPAPKPGPLPALTQSQNHLPRNSSSCRVPTRAIGTTPAPKLSSVHPTLVAAPCGIAR